MRQGLSVRNNISYYDRLGPKPPEGGFEGTLLQGKMSIQYEKFSARNDQNDLKLVGLNSLKGENAQPPWRFSVEKDKND